MYAAKAGDRELTFDFATSLIHDNLLFVDRETKSVWSQLDGKAVIGDLTGQPLNAIPTIQTTWGRWKDLHPESQVLIIPGIEGIDYLYFNPDAGAPRPEFAEFGHNPSQLGLGIERGGEAIFFPWRKIRGAKKPIESSIGGKRVWIHVDKKGLAAWATDADGRLLAGVMTYIKSWLAFRPESRVYGDKR